MIATAHIRLTRNRVGAHRGCVDTAAVDFRSPIQVGAVGAVAGSCGSLAQRSARLPTTLPADDDDDVHCGHEGQGRHRPREPVILSGEKSYGCSGAHDETEASQDKSEGQCASGRGSSCDPGRQVVISRPCTIRFSPLGHAAPLVRRHGVLYPADRGRTRIEATSRRLDGDFPRIDA